MTGLRLVPLGVGDAFSALYYSSCLAVGTDDSWLLVDCPHPIRKILREGTACLSEPLDVSRLNGIVLTHLHADHCCGLEGLGFFAHYILQRRVPLLAHPIVTERLWDGHLAACMEGEPVLRNDGTIRSRRLDDYFELHPLSLDEPVTFGPFTIRCRRTIHPVPTTALRIQGGGRTLGYSADTAFDPSLIEWLAEADRIVHETNHGIHTPYDKLAELPAALRARMNLIHFPDDFDRTRSAIEPLRQGECYMI